MAIDPLGIYSAVVSTCVAGWQFYNSYYRDGARLRLYAGGNRILVGGGGRDPETYVVVNAVNIGNRDTIIQAIGVQIFDSRWKRLRRRARQTMIMIPSERGHAVPHELKPGHTFMGLGLQTDELVKYSREKMTYMLVSHSVGKRDLLVRLHPILDLKPD